jgi:hypothetical protein
MPTPTHKQNPGGRDHGGAGISTAVVLAAIGLAWITLLSVVLIVSSMFDDSFGFEAIPIGLIPLVLGCAAFIGIVRKNETIIWLGTAPLMLTIFMPGLLGFPYIPGLVSMLVAAIAAARSSA